MKKIYGHQKNKLSPYLSGIIFMTPTLDGLPMDHIDIMTPIMVGLVMDLITMDPYIWVIITMRAMELPQ